MARNFLYDGVVGLDFCDLSKKDALEVLKMRNHKSVSQWMYSAQITQKAHFDFIKKLRKNSASLYWLFKYDSLLLGVGSLTRININHKHAYIGIYKNPELYNDVNLDSNCVDSGLDSNKNLDSSSCQNLKQNPSQNLSAGKKILETLEKIAFYDFGLHSLHLEVMESNAKAIRFYERNGYKLEGKLKDFMKKDNAFIDVLIYGKILNYK